MNHAPQRRIPARYREKIHCDSCAAVCCRLTVTLAADDQIPEHLTTCTDNGVRVMAHGAHGACAALDAVHGTCSIYAIRPAVCRRFVMGGPYCRQLRRDEALRPTHLIPLTLTP